MDIGCPDSLRLTLVATLYRLLAPEGDLAESRARAMTETGKLADELAWLVAFPDLEENLDED
jgi:hypothetical protein